MGCLNNKQSHYQAQYHDDILQQGKTWQLKSTLNYQKKFHHGIQTLSPINESSIIMRRKQSQDLNCGKKIFFQNSVH